MNFINSWKAKNKQNDKVNITCRLGSFTLIEIKWDFSSKKGRFMFFNLGYESV